jgi:hypothetical protein
LRYAKVQILKSKIACCEIAGALINTVFGSLKSSYGRITGKLGAAPLPSHFLLWKTGGWRGRKTALLCCLDAIEVHAR